MPPKKQLAISDFFSSQPKALPIKSPNKRTPSPDTSNSLLEFSAAPNAKRSKTIAKQPSPTPSDTTPEPKSLSRVGKKSNIATKTTRKSNAKLTPLEQQILDLKNQHPDKLLAIQVGYKYKMFGRDAEQAAHILNIMYIPRDDKDGQFSYCSFPDVRLHINLQRLLVHGHKVGVVKQMESAIVKQVEKTGGSDVMVRELTAVYTQGTYLGDESEQVGRASEDHGAYIMAIFPKGDQYHLVAAHPSTGEIVWDSFPRDDGELDTRIRYLAPSEAIVVAADDDIKANKLLRLANPSVSIHLCKPRKSPVEDLQNWFDASDVYEKYSAMVPELQHAVLELCIYLQEFNLDTMFTITGNVSSFQDRPRYMVLSDATCRALDVFETSYGTTKGTLFWQLDCTKTRFGKRMLRRWVKKPLIEKDSIDRRHQAIADLLRSNQVVDTVVAALGNKVNAIDLEELLIKVHYSATSKVPRGIHRKDVYSLLSILNDIMEIIQKFDDQVNQLPKELGSGLVVSIFHSLQEAAKVNSIGTLLGKIRSQFREFKEHEQQVIEFFNLDADGFGGEIAAEQQKLDEIAFDLDQELERVRDILGRPTLTWLTNNKEPFLIEVRNGKDVDKLPEDFNRVNGTQTVSRFRTAETGQLYKLQQYHQQRLIDSCNRAYQQFLQQIDAVYPQLAEVVAVLGELDCLVALRDAGSRFGSVCRARLVDDQVINVEEGTHPILSTVVDAVANSTALDKNDHRVFIITGPNMGGKSSYVKQVALFAIMNQVGCWIPAKSATMGVFDRILLRMGASDDILRGQSTFMTEMSECSQIIGDLTSKSLVILDEIGRGTGTTDGIALASAILRYLIEVDEKPLVMFITHYPSLHTLDRCFGTVNFHMGYQQVAGNDCEVPEVVFLYTVEPGVANSSYGLNVAKIAGIPSDIINRAHVVSDELRERVESGRKQRLEMLMEAST